MRARRRQDTRSTIYHRMHVQMHSGCTQMCHNLTIASPFSRHEWTENEFTYAPLTGLKCVTQRIRMDASSTFDIINTSRAAFSTIHLRWKEANAREKKCRTKLTELMGINRLQDTKFRSLIHSFYIFRREKEHFRGFVVDQIRAAKQLKRNIIHWRTSIVWRIPILERNSLFVDREMPPKIILSGFSLQFLKTPCITGRVGCRKRLPLPGWMESVC